MKPNINSEIKSASVSDIFFHQYTDFSAHQSCSCSQSVEGQLTANFDITYWTIHFSIPGKGKTEFSVLQTVPASSGAYPTSIRYRV
jgi:hypothetical protein